MQALVRRLPLVVVLAALGACASHPMSNPPVYSSSRPGASVHVQYGYVRSLDYVNAQQATSGGGALAGAIIGAVIGRQMGGGSNGRAAGTAVGAVGGAIIGNEIEKHQTNARARWRVMVDPENGGSPLTFDVPDAGGLYVGERVRIENNQIYRL